MCNQRWISYFDFLGFRHEVEETHLDLIMSKYKKALNKTESIIGNRSKYGIYYTWFSDTFVIYSKDDSLESYTWIEQATRHFMLGILESEIPLRGALTNGEFYVDKEQGIYIGKGLIEAYDYCEGQNWLGFIISPKAYKRLLMLGKDLDEDSFYSNSIPEKIFYDKIIEYGDIKNIYAFTMSGLFFNNSNTFLEYIRELKNIYIENQEKYINTEKFILENGHESLEK